MFITLIILVCPLSVHVKVCPLSVHNCPTVIRNIDSTKKRVRATSSLVTFLLFVLFLASQSKLLAKTKKGLIIHAPRFKPLKFKGPPSVLGSSP